MSSLCPSCFTDHGDPLDALSLARCPPCARIAESMLTDQAIDETAVWLHETEPETHAERTMAAVGDWESGR